MAKNGQTCHSFPPIVELNVGGVFYTTSLQTLCKDEDSLLCHMFTGKSKPPLRDGKGKYFIDRDGVLFRYVLDYLRNQRLILPENFHEKDRLRSEAESFKLTSMVECIEKTDIVHTHHVTASRPGDGAVNASWEGCRSGYITVGYRGTFAFGRDGLADVKFRKLSRILVSGRVTLCREAFGETLNESRDPDRGTSDRYSSRFFLKHNFLEQAFDNLSDCGFTLIAACASGTSSGTTQTDQMGKNTAQQFDSEESKWNHYNEFVFYRPWRGSPHPRKDCRLYSTGFIGFPIHDSCVALASGLVLDFEITVFRDWAEALCSQQSWLKKLISCFCSHGESIT